MNKTKLAGLVMRADPDLSGFFLARLTQLIARQAAAVSPAERAVLGLAAFSTFLDCLDLGLAEEAYAIVEQVRDERGDACSAA